MMSLPSTFQERVQQIEETRNQRLSLLQAEKELQIKKSRLLSEKQSNIRCVEQRCLLLERRNAELGFQILAKKSQIDALDARYQATARDFRALKSEVEELEKREKERDRFYETQRLEMETFKEQKGRFLLDSRADVQKLRNSVAELKSTLKDLQSNDGYLNYAEIAAAEARKADLLAEKEKLDKNLASSYQLRTLLQKQLQKILVSQDAKIQPAE